MSQPDLTPFSALQRAAEATVDQQEVCPRCRHTAVVRRDAPDGSGVWSINACGHCYFSWRSTEDAIHVLEASEAAIYQLRDSDIDRLTIPVPLLATSV